MTIALFNNNINTQTNSQVDKFVSQPDNIITANNANKSIDTHNAKGNLGSLRENMSNTEVSKKLASFKEILSQVTNEVNVENSLNLTLTKDINDVIAQLNAFVKINTDDESETDNRVDNEIFGQLYALNAEIIEKNDSDIQINTDVQMNDDIQIESDTELFQNVEEAESTEISAKSTDIDSDKSEKRLSALLDDEMLSELNIESVDSETDYTEEDSMMNRQSPEEHSMKAMMGTVSEKFELNNVKLTEQTNSLKMHETNSDKLMEQITKQLEGLRSNSKVNIVLNPESLGKVDLQIINTKEGLSAQFTVTTNEARDLLMKGLDGLKESLLAQGVGVDNVSVKVSETEESSYNQDWTEQESSQEGNKGNSESNKQEKEKGLFEKTIAMNLKKENGKK